MVSELRLFVEQEFQQKAQQYSAVLSSRGVSVNVEIIEKLPITLEGRCMGCCKNHHESQCGVTNTTAHSGELRPWVCCTVRHSKASVTCFETS